MVFKTGFEGYDQELLEESSKEGGNGKPNTFYLKTNEAKEIIMLDDTGFRFMEHSFYNQITRRSVEFTCRGQDCVVCNLKSPALITVCTVKDMAGYTKKSGEKAGVGEKKLFKIKKTAAKMLNDLRKIAVDQKAEYSWNNQRDICTQHGYKTIEEVKNAIYSKGNVFKNATIRAARYGEKSENCGDNFTFIRFIKKEDLTKIEEPFDYEKVFALKSNEAMIYELKVLYGNNVPPEFAHILGTGLQPELANGTTPTNGQNAAPQREVAPTYTVDDIPF